MSLVPLLFSDWWQDLDRPHNLMDQDFGLGLYPEQLVTPRGIQLYLQPSKKQALDNYIRPWADLLRQAQHGGVSTVGADKNTFQVTLDVQQFKPDEIDVKVVDRHVIVDAKHEERRDEHGWISRQFTRKYLIPEQCDIDQVTSKLSSDGVLSILVPRKEEPRADKNERVIKIQHTGKPAVQPKEDTSKKVEKKAEDKK